MPAAPDTSIERALAGRRALVTGAGSGIGRATALLLASAGARVIVQDIDATRVDTVAREIATADGNAEAAACDVADEAALRRFVDAGPAVTLLVNNAGVGSPDRTIEAIDRA